jgi:hypothetical protein
MIWYTRTAVSPSGRKVSECNWPAVRRLQIVVVLLLLAITVAADQVATVRGEIADTFCYAARGIRGPSHTACALRCARKGIPLALVEDGTRRVYILLPPKDESGLPESVISSAGTVRTVTGRVFVTAGTRFLTVDSIR